MSLLTIGLLTIAACALFISRRPSDATHASRIVSRGALALVLCLVAAGYFSTPALAQRAAVPPDARGTGPSQQTLAHHEGGEANLILPDLSKVEFLGVNGHNLLLVGILVCFLGLLFGYAIFVNLKNRSVHPSMQEISELIYETCKTYLVTQGRSEEHTSELQSRSDLVCRLLLEKKKKI